MAFESFKHSRFFKGLKIYLISSSVLIHVLIAFMVLQFFSGFLGSGPTFAKALTNNGRNINTNYPSIGVVGDSLLSVGNKLETPDHFTTDFDASQWPTVGPKSLHHTELVPEEFLANRLYVSNIKELQNAVQNATPGSVIVMRNGSYSFNGKKISLSKDTPSKEQPIYLVAEESGKVRLEMETSEGFYINQPHWNFIGIQFVGTCAKHNRCHHAFHVVANGDYFYAAHNEFIDFNAAIKVNQIRNVYPDNGKIEFNHFYYTGPRTTKSPITPINMDNGAYWITRNNIIRDFLKFGGNRISYGAFYKGGAIGGEISNNLIICETGPSQARGATVGLSLGGGGMNPVHRRHQANFETNQVVVSNNIVMHCNDVALYVNKGQESIIYNNTFYNTSGLDLRFPETSGHVFNNVLLGKIRKRQGGSGTLDHNLVLARDYWSGDNPMKTLYADPQNGNFALLQSADTTQLNQALVIPTEYGEENVDFCGVPLTSSLIKGAIQQGSQCFPTTQ